MSLSLSLLSCQKSELSNSENNKDQKQQVSTEDLTILGISTSEIVSGFNFRQSSLVGNGISNSEIYQVDNSNSISIESKGKGGKGKGGSIVSKRFSIDGISLIAINDTLLAITDFENVNENIKNINAFIYGGGTVTHYDASGNVITGLNVNIPISGIYSSIGKKRGGGAYLYREITNIDSLFSTIAKTEINYGTGVSIINHLDTVLRSGKIVITRSGTYPNITENINFENYFVNGIGITGTKTIAKSKTKINDTTFTFTNQVNGTGTLVFTNGSVANIKLNRSRTNNYIISLTTNKIIGGTITTTANNALTTSDNYEIYKYVTTTPVVEDLSCTTRRKPSNGLITINYLNNLITINLAGSCSSYTITITINGVVTTKTI